MELSPALSEASLFSAVAGLPATGFAAPAGTPAAIVQRLNTELANIAAQPDIKARLASLGVDHSANTPAQFSDYLASERAKWVKIVKDGKIQL